MDTSILKGKICHWGKPPVLIPRPPTLSDALIQSRGFSDGDLHPDFGADPMHSAAARIADTLANLKPGVAFISADYDVDGITSATIIGKMLRVAGWKVEVSIPSRFIEGYGVNKTAIDEVIKLGIADCVLALDCGATELKYLTDLTREGAFPVFVVDHHKRSGIAGLFLQELNPQLYLDSGVQEDGYCTGVLCAMIAYHFSKRFPLYKEYLSDALFFGGLAAIADVISMKSIASRALADRFLKEAGSKMKNLGFRLYMKACGLADGVMTTADVGFKLVPPLNAAGRLDDPNGVMALFDESVTTDGADRMIHKLQTLNLDRRREQDAICSDAHRAYEKGPALAYYSKNWHIGVVGPAAGRLAEALNIPVFLGGYSYNTKSFSFSGRSGGSGIDIHALLSKVLEGLPVQMGGHRAALGFRIKETDIESVFPVIQERLMALTPEVVPLRKCDVIVSTVSLNHWEEIRKLEPFGNGNPEPVVCVPKVSVELRKNPDRSDMSTGTAITCDGRRFECLIFHNPVLSSVTRFYGDIVGKLICDRRGSTPIVKLIIEDFIPPTP